MQFQDILRSIVLAEIIVTFLFTGLIACHYAKRQYAAKQMNSNLTWHVLTMLLVFLGICAYCFADVLVRFETPLTWRAPVLIALFAFAITGEVFMLRHQVAPR